MPRGQQLTQAELPLQFRCFTALPPVGGGGIPESHLQSDGEGRALFGVACYDVPSEAIDMRGRGGDAREAPRVDVEPGTPKQTRRPSPPEDVDRVGRGALSRTEGLLGQAGRDVSLALGLDAGAIGIAVDDPPLS